MGHGRAEWIFFGFFALNPPWGLAAVDTFDTLLPLVTQANLPYVGPHVGTPGLGMV